MYDGIFALNTSNMRSAQTGNVYASRRAYAYARVLFHFRFAVTVANAATPESPPSTTVTAKTAPSTMHWCDGSFLATHVMLGCPKRSQVWAKSGAFVTKQKTAPDVMTRQERNKSGPVTFSGGRGIVVNGVSRTGGLRIRKGRRRSSVGPI